MRIFKLIFHLMGEVLMNMLSDVAAQKPAKISNTKSDLGITCSTDCVSLTGDAVTNPPLSFHQPIKDFRYL